MQPYAFEYMMANGGLCSEGDYPYSDATHSGTSNGTCLASACVPVAGSRPSSWAEVAACNFSAPFTGHDDDDSKGPDRPPYENMTCVDGPLMSALNKGPVTVSVEADTDAFHLYKSGVVTNVSCGIALDHAVLAVGYGFDTDRNLTYWKVKNR